MQHTIWKTLICIAIAGALQAVAQDAGHQQRA